MKRRHMLSALGALPLAACTWRLGAPERAECVVVGAGLAGLSAALSLQRAGLTVILLDAQGHVGGRLMTLEVNSVTFDVGAVEVGTSYTTLHAAATEYGVTFFDPPKAAAPPSLCISIDGTLIDAGAWSNSASNPMLDATLRALPPAAWLPRWLAACSDLSQPQDWIEAKHDALDIPLGQFLRERFSLDAQTLRLAEHASNYESFAAVSALDVLRRDAIRKATPQGSSTQFVKGGSGALPVAMAAALKQAPQHAKLVSVESERARYRIRLQTLSGSRTIVTDRLVLAVPAPALDRIPLPLTDELQARLNPLWRRPATGISTAHYLPTRKFWLEDKLPVNLWTDSAIERLFAVTDADGSVSRLIVWINGANARRLDGLSDEDFAQFVEEELFRIRPSTRDSLNLLATQRWGRDPLFGGAYPEIATCQVARVRQAYQALSSLPAGFALAGDFCVFDKPGMEAACISGIRAADQVLLRK